MFARFVKLMLKQPTAYRVPLLTLRLVHLPFDRRCGLDSSALPPLFSVHLSVHLSVCLFVCPSVCLPVCRSVCLSVRPSARPPVRLLSVCRSGSFCPADRRHHHHDEDRTSLVHLLQYYFGKCINHPLHKARMVDDAIVILFATAFSLQRPNRVTTYVQVSLTMSVKSLCGYGRVPSLHPQRLITM